MCRKPSPGNPDSIREIPHAAHFLKLLTTPTPERIRACTACILHTAVYEFAEMALLATHMLEGQGQIDCINIYIPSHGPTHIHAYMPK